jgi:hypothetical protein
VANERTCPVSATSSGLRTRISSSRRCADGRGERLGRPGREVGERVPEDHGRIRCVRAPIGRRGTRSTRTAGIDRCSACGAGRGNVLLMRTSITTPVRV